MTDTHHLSNHQYIMYQVNITKILHVLNFIVSICTYVKSSNDSCVFNRVKTAHPYMSNQCIVTHRDDKDCLQLKNYGIPEINCDDILHVNMLKEYSHEQLVQSVDVLDHPDNPRPPLAIKVTITDISSLIIDDMNIEIEIDKFLTYRPWWKLVHDNGGLGRGHVSDRGMFVIIFERYPISWRPYLQFLVNTQYLSADNCEKTPMLAGRMSGEHPGLMPVLSK